MACGSIVNPLFFKQGNAEAPTRSTIDKEQKAMITIDGAMGEGGGQILRSSLALSLVTGKPFCMVNIRSRRKKGGLLGQHLAALKAAAEIGDARVQGGHIGSREVTFEPVRITPGEYAFATGTAGSAPLVLQTVLPALMTASAPARLVLEGGTHNQHSPPFDFLAKVFLPCIERMGPKIVCNLDRAGFYPAGGGRISVAIDPCQKLKGLYIPERGEIKKIVCTAMVSRLNPDIGHREIKVVRDSMNFPEECCEVIEIKNSPGPGNILVLEIVSENITEVITGFGKLGIPAEQVARTAVKALRQYLSAGVPVGIYLADQLLLPLVLAGEGSFRTLSPSRHTLTNIDVMKAFTETRIDCRPTQGAAWEISVNAMGETK